MHPPAPASIGTYDWVHNLECAALLVKIPRTSAASPAEFNNNKNSTAGGTSTKTASTMRNNGGNTRKNQLS